MTPTYCGACMHPIRRRWWHLAIPPLPVHRGDEAAECRVRMDALAVSVRT